MQDKNDAAEIANVSVFQDFYVLRKFGERILNAYSPDRTVSNAEKCSHTYKSSKRITKSPVFQTGKKVYLILLV